MSLRSLSGVVSGLATLALVACSNASVGPATQPVPSEQTEKIRQQYGTIHGEDGFSLFDSRSKPEDGAGGGGGIGVNVYLWRAALETIDFMPLVQADPFGGVIISDWHSPSASPDERFKLTIYILDRALRADAVKVAVFRQINDAGRWTDATVDPGTKTGIEDSILTRARELRIAALGTAQG
jgi:uncharacterized protein DUF3576